MNIQPLILIRRDEDKTLDNVLLGGSYWNEDALGGLSCNQFVHCMSSSAPYSNTQADGYQDWFVTDAPPVGRW